MTKLEALQNLLERVEAGKYKFNGWADQPLERKHMAKVDDAFNGSLDAAKALHEAVLPGWRPSIELGGFDAFNRQRPADQWTAVLWYKNPSSILALEGPLGKNADPARAWLIAILRALIATADMEGR